MVRTSVAVVQLLLSLVNVLVDESIYMILFDIFLLWSPYKLLPCHLMCRYLHVVEGAHICILTPPLNMPLFGIHDKPTTFSLKVIYFMFQEQSNMVLNTSSLSDLSNRRGVPGIPDVSGRKATGCCIRVPFDVGTCIGHPGNYKKKQIFLCIIEPNHVLVLAYFFLEKTSILFIHVQTTVWSTMYIYVRSQMMGCWWVQGKTKMHNAHNVIFRFALFHSMNTKTIKLLCCFCGPSVKLQIK